MTDEELAEAYRYATNPMTTGAAELYAEALRARAEEARLFAEVAALRAERDAAREILGRDLKQANERVLEQLRAQAGLAKARWGVKREPTKAEMRAVLLRYGREIRRSDATRAKNGGRNTNDQVFRYVDALHRVYNMAEAIATPKRKRRGAT